MYDFFVKLLGTGISATIFFMPLKLDYQEETIIIAAQLQNPVTEEIAQLVESGFIFRLLLMTALHIIEKLLNSYPIKMRNGR